MARAAVLIALLLAACGGESAEPAGFDGDASLLIEGPDGEPVPGARVEYFSVADHRAEAEPLGSALAGTDGRAPAPSGEERVVAVVRADGLATEVRELAGTGPVRTVMLSRPQQVEGLVLDLSGRPLAGARVLYPTTAPFAVQSVTDERGAFCLGPLPEHVRIRAEAQGHAPLDLSLALFPDEGRDLVFYLVREQHVTGRVVNGSGRGVPGALVVLDQESVSRVAADEEGRFVLPGVLSDWEVLLTPCAEGLRGPTVTAVPGQQGVTLPLFRPAEVRGRVVVRETGAPVEEFKIRRVDYGELVKPGEGRFVLTGLLPGETRIQVVAGHLKGELTLNLAEGEIVTEATIALVPPPWGDPRDPRVRYPLRLRAKEAEVGGPAAGALVRGTTAGDEARTGTDGEVLLLLPPGRSTLTVGGAFDRFALREVEVFVPEEENAEVELAPNREGVLELDPVRVRDGSKYWLHSDGEVLEGRLADTRPSFFVDPSRRFDVLVKVKRQLPAWLRGVRLPDDGRIPVSLDEGAVIRGRCRGEGDHPLAKVITEVTEHPLDARMETAGDGLIGVGGLEPGRYHVLIYARNVRTKRLVVDLPAAGLDLGEVRMRAPADLHVLVTTSRGAPVPGAVVETSILVASKAMTDNSGRVRLPGRNEEEVLRVRAEGYLDSWQDVRIPDERRRVETTVKLYRPGSLLIRAVDREGRPVEVEPPRDLESRSAGPGMLLIPKLSPGPVTIEFTDGTGRRATLHTVVLEGSSRSETVVFE